MKNWFNSFEECLRGGNATSDLIGAGTADAERAMRHYRFQHEMKLKEAVEETFPVLLKNIGNEWDGIWSTFHAQNEISPRSLDWFPEVFLNYFLKSSHPLWMKELARFEHAMDVHPWSHPALSLKSDLALSEDSCVHLGKYEVLKFMAPVISLYEEEEAELSDELTLILWQKEDGTYYRAMKDWEVSVLSKLHLGVEAALEEAPEDPEEVGEFFQWLGSSCLMQRLSQV